MLSGCFKKSLRSADQSLDSYRFAKQDPDKDLGNDLWVDQAGVSKNYQVSQQEARLIDIPIPIRALALKHANEPAPNAENQAQVLAYRVHLKPAEIHSFFEIEMERLGWNMIADMHDTESMMVFLKPTKVCTVSLRNDDGAADTLAVISFGNHKAAMSDE